MRIQPVSGYFRHSSGQLNTAPISRYVRRCTVIKLPPESFNSAAEIPNLGKASHESASSCETFLVCDPQITIEPRQLKTLTEPDVNRRTLSIAGFEFPINRPKSGANIGVSRFAIDQLVNPDTIIFAPGGLWNENILLYGSFGTASGSAASQELLKRFAKAVAARFTKVRAYYVGPQALELLKQGKRLTVAEQTPREFDLTIT